MVLLCESSLCISFGNQGPGEWRKSWRGTESRQLEVQSEASTFGLVRDAVTPAAIGPLCSIRSRVSAAIQQGILEIFVLPRGRRHTEPKPPVIGVLLSLSSIELPLIWDIVKRKMRDCRANRENELKASGLGLNGHLDKRYKRRLRADLFKCTILQVELECSKMRDKSLNSKAFY